MKYLLLGIVLVAGCASDKPIEWFPRITAWRNQYSCQDSNQPNSLPMSYKEPEFCRLGSGFIISVGRKT